MRRLFAFVLLPLVLCGCARTHPDSQVALSGEVGSGEERVLTNAHVSIWIPSRSARITEGRVTSIGLYDMAPRGATLISGAVFRDYRILCDITVETKQEFQHYAQLWKDGDDFQEHPHLTMYDRPIGTQLKKDIRDADRGVILSICANVQKTNRFRGAETGTFHEDIETAKKMIESVRLLKVRPDETDFLNPLTVAEVEQVKQKIDWLQPYMTPQDCLLALGLPIGKLNGSDPGPGESRTISMQLRRDRVLRLTCGRRGYVIAAQLEDREWKWKKDEKRH